MKHLVHILRHRISMRLMLGAQEAKALAAEAANTANTAKTAKTADLAQELSATRKEGSKFKIVHILSGLDLDRPALFHKATFTR